jgi:hypothetical protein
MKTKEWFLLALALLLIAGTAGLLLQLRTSRRLGNPGVRTTALPGSQRLEVNLPERVLDYSSEKIETDKITLDVLPQDTSFGHRRYRAPDGFEIEMNAVLMGTDRTSLHKPEICLSGQGWAIKEGFSSPARVPIARPMPYELPVMKLVANKTVTVDGQTRTGTGLYVYWFVADNEYTAHHQKRMWSMAVSLLRTGVLQRWAYLSCLAICEPGQEGPTFERMKSFIADAVPQFQLVPPPPAATAVAQTPLPR